MRGKVNQAKVLAENEEENFVDTRFPSNGKLNLNELLHRRKEEKRIENNLNLKIISGVGAVAVIVILIISF